MSKAQVPGYTPPAALLAAVSIIGWTDQDLAVDTHRLSSLQEVKGLERETSEVGSATDRGLVGAVQSAS